MMIFSYKLTVNPEHCYLFLTTGLRDQEEGGIDRAWLKSCFIFPNFPINRENFLDSRTL